MANGGHQPTPLSARLEALGVLAIDAGTHAWRPVAAPMPLSTPPVADDAAWEQVHARDPALAQALDLAAARFGWTAAAREQSARELLTGTLGRVTERDPAAVAARITSLLDAYVRLRQRHRTSRATAQFWAAVTRAVTRKALRPWEVGATVVRLARGEPTLCVVELDDSTASTPGSGGAPFTLELRRSQANRTLIWRLLLDPATDRWLGPIEWPRGHGGGRGHLLRIPGATPSAPFAALPAEARTLEIEFTAAATVTVTVRLLRSRPSGP